MLIADVLIADVLVVVLDRLAVELEVVIREVDG